MWLRRIDLDHFRNYTAATLSLPRGCTVITGDNGQGKTNLLEAIAVVATLKSFRGAPTEALIRDGASSAVLRAEIDDEDRAGRHSNGTVDLELSTERRNRVLVNGQATRQGRDVSDVLRVSVFTPDDLDLVKGGPAGRRGLLDDTLSSLSRRSDQLRLDVDRVLRQRNTLLRQSGGRTTPEVLATLEVWDDKLGASGTALADDRADLADRATPHLTAAYEAIAGYPARVEVRYDAPWRAHPGGLVGALADARLDDLRRGLTTVGPHRDDLVIELDGGLSRTHASQGEQRSLTLALRLAVHQLVTEETATAPVLLLDDVFSELDPGRTRALVAHLPRHDQIVLTTATGVPEGIAVDHVVEVADGTLLAPVG